MICHTWGWSHLDTGHWFPFSWDQSRALRSWLQYSPSSPLQSCQFNTEIYVQHGQYELVIQLSTLFSWFIISNTLSTIILSSSRRCLWRWPRCSRDSFCSHKYSSVNNAAVFDMINIREESPVAASVLETWSSSAGAHQLVTKSQCWIRSCLIEESDQVSLILMWSIKYLSVLI